MIDGFLAIVKKAGQVLLSADRSLLDVREKSGSKDFVTYYDTAIQEMLRQELLKLLPEAGFLGEESGSAANLSEGYCFIVDPIDGTANFVHDYRHSCISVGLALNGAIIMAAVYDPYLDELFWAEKGKGAYLNRSQITAGDRRLVNGLVLFGTSPYDKSKVNETFNLAGKLFEHALDIRRSGSAALDICYVAAGRCCLFYELSLSPWDFAAGALILQEAGGIITAIDYADIPLDRKSSILAANRSAFEDYKKFIANLQ